ncbi:MAG: hypothetical protein NTX61_17500 [Bacteroidetes bacterium]|nr:hypothetical protein [Bacteroidota bacterium]
METETLKICSEEMLKKRFVKRSERPGIFLFRINGCNIYRVKVQNLVIG